MPTKKFNLASSGVFGKWWFTVISLRWPELSKFCIKYKDIKQDTLTITVVAAIQWRQKIGIELIYQNATLIGKTLFRYGRLRRPPPYACVLPVLASLYATHVASATAALVLVFSECCLAFASCTIKKKFIYHIFVPLLCFFLSRWELKMVTEPWTTIYRTLDFSL